MPLLFFSTLRRRLINLFYGPPRPPLFKHDFQNLHGPPQDTWVKWGPTAAITGPTLLLFVVAIPSPPDSGSPPEEEGVVMVRPNCVERKEKKGVGRKVVMKWLFSGVAVAGLGTGGVEVNKK